MLNCPYISIGYRLPRPLLSHWKDYLNTVIRLSSHLFTDWISAAIYQLNNKVTLARKSNTLNLWFALQSICRSSKFAHFSIPLGYPKNEEAVDFYLIIATKQPPPIIKATHIPTNVSSVKCCGAIAAITSALHRSNNEKPRLTRAKVFIPHLFGQLWIFSDTP